MRGFSFRSKVVGSVFLKLGVSTLKSIGACDSAQGLDVLMNLPSFWPFSLSSRP